MENAKYELILNTMDKMSAYLNSDQLLKLQKVMMECILNFTDFKDAGYSNEEYLSMFEQAKTVEGLSKITIKKYLRSIRKLLEYTNDAKLTEITTETVRNMMVYLQTERKCKNSTVDTLRRQLSSFYEWMREEEYILTNPVKKIHKIKCDKKVKVVFSDEEIEKMRNHCDNKRELALLDLLSSSGMRVSELVSLNIDDIDFNQRECVIKGKGNKERVAYFDARCKVSLQRYIASRKDNDNALFVSLHYPNDRISVRTVERSVAAIGDRTGVGRCFPHKFRASMATKSLDKGMPVEHL